jgi:hypothetical protein
MRLKDIKVGQHLYLGHGAAWREYQEWDDGEVVVVDTRPNWYKSNWSTRTERIVKVESGIEVALTDHIQYSSADQTNGILVRVIMEGKPTTFCVAQLRHLHGNAIACLHEIAVLKEEQRIAREERNAVYLQTTAIKDKLVMALSDMNDIHGISVDMRYHGHIVIELDDASARMLYNVLTGEVLPDVLPIPEEASS